MESSYLNICLLKLFAASIHKEDLESFCPQVTGLLRDTTHFCVATVGNDVVVYE